MVLARPVQAVDSITVGRIIRMAHKIQTDKMCTPPAEVASIQIIIRVTQEVDRLFIGAVAVVTIPLEAALLCIL